MPRTHRWTWLGALALAVCPTLALGQEATQAQATPQSHTVRKGDTLWDLARTYKGDPFLWPDIYRLNTSVVEDPHWIYPGEVLSLDGSAPVASVPAQDTPSAADSSTAVASTQPDSGAAGAGGAAPDEAAPAEPAPQQTAAEDVAPEHQASLAELLKRDYGDEPPRLFGPKRGDGIRETFSGYIHQNYRPLRESEFYSSGFLTENDRLPFGQVIGPVTPPQIQAHARESNALPYSTIALAAPKGAVYQVGDTLMLVQLGAELKPYGDVVIPTGLARVSDTADGNYVAMVVAVYGEIRRGQKVLPAEAFVPGGTAKAAPVADGIEARLLGGPSRQDLKVPQMIVFLDKGRQDGVAPGDLFEVRRQPERLPDGSLRVDEVMATLQVVHARQHTATARYLNIISPDIPPGTKARQAAKLP
jgi:LysM repeat protein